MMEVRYTGTTRFATRFSLIWKSIQMLKLKLLIVTNEITIDMIFFDFYI